jgi:hypothetical protein
MIHNVDKVGKLSVKPTISQHNLHEKHACILAITARFHCLHNDIGKQHIPSPPEQTMVTEIRKLPHLADPSGN